MRATQHNNNGHRRMRGRSNHNGGRKGPNPLTRSYESNGPDIKVRGSAQHVADKYMQLARDAQSSGDRVAAESYFQYAEHYNRLIAEAQIQLYGEVQRPAEGEEEGEFGFESRPLRPSGAASGEEGFDYTVQPQPQGQPFTREQGDTASGERGERFERSREHQDRPQDRPQDRYGRERFPDRDRPNDRQEGRGERQQGRGFERPRYEQQGEGEERGGRGRFRNPRFERDRPEGYEQRPRFEQNERFEPRREHGARGDASRGEPREPRESRGENTRGDFVPHGYGRGEGRSFEGRPRFDENRSPDPRNENRTEPRGEFRGEPRGELRGDQRAPELQPDHGEERAPVRRGRPVRADRFEVPRFDAPQNARAPRRPAPVEEMDDDQRLPAFLTVPLASPSRNIAPEEPEAVQEARPKRGRRRVTKVEGDVLDLPVPETPVAE